MLLPGIISSEGDNLLPQDGSLICLQEFFDPKEAADLFVRLKDGIKWKSDLITMYGKQHPLPRLTAWYGDPGKVYVYSKIVNHPEPWSKDLSMIKSRIEEHSGVDLNSLLLNLYRSGDDHLSWHADNEKELGINPFIASLSLGGVRRFQLKHRYETSLPTITLDLEPGSLVLMSGEIQDYWLHRIAPTKKPVDPRINLTFRKIY